MSFEGYTHDPFAVELGTLTIRTELSALPDTSSEDVGLKAMVVGGNSWALRIVTRGYTRMSYLASSIRSVMHVHSSFLHPTVQSTNLKIQNPKTSHPH